MKELFIVDVIKPWEKSIKSLFKRSFPKSNANYLIKTSKNSVWILLTNDKKLIGSACIQNIKKDEHNYIFLFNLAVFPEYRRMSYGSELFEYVKKYASNTNNTLVWRVHKDKPEVQAFYEKNGAELFSGSPLFDDLSFVYYRITC